MLHTVRPFISVFMVGLMGLNPIAIAQAKQVQPKPDNSTVFLGCVKPEFLGKNPYGAAEDAWRITGTAAMGLGGASVAAYGGGYLVLRTEEALQLDSKNARAILADYLKHSMEYKSSVARVFGIRKQLGTAETLGDRAESSRLTKELETAKNEARRLEAISATKRKAIGGLVNLNNLKPGQELDKIRAQIAAHEAKVNMMVKRSWFSRKIAVPTLTVSGVAVILGALVFLYSDKLAVHFNPPKPEDANRAPNDEEIRKTDEIVDCLVNLQDAQEVPVKDEERGLEIDPSGIPATLQEAVR
jgi:hypothetical protein